MDAPYKPGIPSNTGRPCKKGSGGKARALRQALHNRQSPSLPPAGGKEEIEAPTWIFYAAATLGSETFRWAMNANLRNVINQAFFALGKKQVNFPGL